jgi:hypothetical protein
MASAPHSSSFYFVPLLLLLMLVVSSSTSATTSALASMPSSSGGGDAGNNDTAELRPGNDLLKYKSIRAMLKKLNKPSVKTIQVVTHDGKPFLSVIIIFFLERKRQALFKFLCLRG